MFIFYDEPLVIEYKQPLQTMCRSIVVNILNSHTYFKNVKGSTKDPSGIDFNEDINK